MYNEFSQQKILISNSKSTSMIVWKMIEAEKPPDAHIYRNTRSSQRKTAVVSYQRDTESDSNKLTFTLLYQVIIHLQ